MAGTRRNDIGLETLTRFICPICGNYSWKLPLDGLMDTGAKALPIKICLHCGPVYWEVMEKNADHEPHAQISEIELFHHMLKLAIDELHDPNPIIRENACWWIFQDMTEGIDSSGGYISFQAACEILGINTD